MVQLVVAMFIPHIALQVGHILQGGMREVRYHTTLLFMDWLVIVVEDVQMFMRIRFLGDTIHQNVKEQQHIIRVIFMELVVVETLLIVLFIRALDVNRYCFSV
jgi:hypothetical protein